METCIVPTLQRKPTSKAGTAAPTLRTQSGDVAVAQATGAMTSLVGKMIELDPNMIRPSVNTRRSEIDPTTVADLAKELRSKEIGQLQPVGCYYAPSAEFPGQDWVLTYGNRRHAAALVNRNGNKDLAVKGDDKFLIRVIVRPTPNDTEGGKRHSLSAFRATRSENHQREELTELDDAHTAALLRDEFGLETNKEIAGEMGISPAWVGTLLDVQDNLDPRLKELIASERLTFKQGAKYVGLNEDGIIRIIAAVEAAEKATMAALSKAAKEPTPEEAETAKQKAGKAAAKTAGDAVNAQRGGTPKKSNAGRKSSGPELRTVQEVRACFADLTTAGRPDNLRACASAIVDFIIGKTDKQKAQNALILLATGKNVPAPAKAAGVTRA